MNGFSDGTSRPGAAEQGERPRLGFWSKLARLWRSEEALPLRPEPLAAEVLPGEPPEQAVSEGAEIRGEFLEAPAGPVEAQERGTMDSEGPRGADGAQPASELARENAALRATVETQQQEMERLSREIQDVRQADAEALEELREEVERERKHDQEALRLAREKLSAELQDALEQNRQLQSLVEKLRADLTHADSELHHVNAERQRLLNEYGQLCMETIGLRQAGQELQRLKEEARRLREELEQARAAPAPAPARGSRKTAELSAELAQREKQIQGLRERIASMEQELAARGPLVPLSSLHPTLQQILAQMGTAGEAQRIITDLWDRLLDQETRYNAAREDTNRKSSELDMLRTQLAELYLGLITPITVLSASADLLAMRRELPQDVLGSLEEMKEIMGTIRQVIVRMQKIGAPGRDKP